MRSVYHIELSALNKRSHDIERGRFGVCARYSEDARRIVTARLQRDGYTDICIRSTVNRGRQGCWDSGDVLCYQMA